MSEKTKKAVFEYLEVLRMSGQMNMMGAPKVLQEEFGLDRNEAREVFMEWAKKTEEAQS